jgi:hypothetical protein
LAGLQSGVSDYPEGKERTSHMKTKEQKQQRNKHVIYDAKLDGDNTMSRN